MFQSLISGRAKLWLGASVATIIAMGSAGAAYAADDNTGPIETVVVTGFKQSIERALDAKKAALDSSDSILAEDIAKFPDLNLSESIQRIPGVALSRDEGEGREISVRGLGPQFTRVRINGMEALATTGSEDISGGTNRSRAFDFNVFASDLFQSITVHKSASADLEEGSLGATVDLHTAHPLDYDHFTFVTSFQGGYNDLAGSFNPRGAVLVADQFLGGRLGVLFSGAYAVQNTLEDGTSSVRWQNDNTAQNAAHSEPLVAGCASGCSASQRFGSVLVTSILPGTNPAQVIGSTETTGGTGGVPNDFDVVNEAFHPRFPRYDVINNDSKRLGLTGSVQYQPDQDTLFTLDALFADYAVERNEYYLEAPSFSIAGVMSNLAPAGAPALLAPTLGVGSIHVIGYSIDPATNNLESIEATNVGLRSEHRLDHLDTRFEQVTLNGSHSFSDTLKINGSLGWSESHHRNPIQTTLTMDYNCTPATSGTGSTAGCPGGVGGGAGTAANPYTFDYSGGNSRTPAISYGNVDVNNPAGWFLSQIRERAEFNYVSYRNATVDGEWSPYGWLKLQAGFDYRNFGFGTQDLRRSDGSTATLDSFIPSAIESTSLASYTQSVHLTGLSLPGGTPTSWVVPSITQANSLFNIFDPTAFPTVRATGAPPCNTAPGCGAFQLGPQPALSANGSVYEDDIGGWVQAGWDTTFYGVPFRGNIGGRYVDTTDKSVGFSFNAIAKAVVPTTVSQNYHDFLPSLNAVLSPSDDFLVRFNASQVLARPDLTGLLPGATVSKSGSNLTVKIGNPFLKPFRAKTADLSFEWYYHKGALLSASFFYKHIDDLVTSLVQNIPYAGNPFGLPTSLAQAACGGAFTSACNDTLIWQFTTPANQKGSPLYGMEINWQQPFDFLPGMFENTGFLGNVTFVQARQNYLNADGSIQAIADLQNLSRTSYNATLYYDDGTFQGRVSGAFRSKYLPSSSANPNPGNLNDVIVNGSTFNLDVSTSYKWDDNFTLTFEGINLTNQHQYQYVDSIGMRTYFDHQTGTNYFFGIRYTY